MPYKLISLVFLLFILTVNIAYSEGEFILPVKKPSIFKKVEKNISIDLNKNLPQPKPITQNKKNTKIVPSEDKKQKILEEEKITPTKKIKIVKNNFIYPQKKPVTYKISSKEIEKSSILNQKDFEKAKETLNFVKARKWNSALKSTEKVKNSEFRILIKWMYLKTTGNAATFNDYKNFIEQHENYPRINRIKYLAEQKIYLRNNSPTSIIK